MGLCDSIHILTIVYQEIARGRSRERAIVQALGHSGLAVVVTSLTTAGGLLSFSMAEIAPVSALGVIAPIGVLLAMFYSLSLLPALLAFCPLRPRAVAQGVGEHTRLRRSLVASGTWAAQHPAPVLAGSLLVLLIGAGGLGRLRFSHDPLRWFPQWDPLRVASELLDREFSGASALEVLVETPRDNGLHEPDTLARLERAMRYSESLEIAGRPVGKAVSIVDVVKEIHQALNENRPDAYVVPPQRRLIAQELLLFENSGSDDLEDLTDSRFRTARMTVRMPWTDSLAYPPVLDQMAEALLGIFGETLSFELTGSLALFSRIFDALVVSMASSYVFALAVITPLLVLLIGNLRRGLAAMIPNLIPIYLVLALMGWLAIPLDASTLLIGGIILGLAVDDTIHFMHGFNRYFERDADLVGAVRETLATTGTALLFTSIVLTLGFAVFVLSYMENASHFGLLTAFATVVAFVADVLVGPALIATVTPRKRLVA